MSTFEALRRLDDRFVPRRDADEQAARAARWLPWVLGVTAAAQVAALATENDFYEGAVLSGLGGSLVGALQIRRRTPNRAPAQRAGRE